MSDVANHQPLQSGHNKATVQQDAESLEDQIVSRQQTPGMLPIGMNARQKAAIQMQRMAGNAATVRMMSNARSSAGLVQRDEAGAPAATIPGRTLGGVSAIQQPSGMACWATVTTMMASYKDGASYTVADIGAVVGRAGSQYTDIYNADTGLTGAQKGPFLDAMGLHAEPPASYTGEGLSDMMSSYGPLWVTTDGGSLNTVHARVLIGIGGDGTPDGTILSIIDPADGQVHQETLGVFSTRYSNVGILDATAGRAFRAQIVHW